MTTCRLLLALLFAALVDHVRRAQGFYQTPPLPNTVAPSIASEL